jgi:protein gp37
MGERTEISWCDSTFNPWVGCTKVSPACDHCYAEGWAKRSGMVEWGNAPRRRTKTWNNPLKWQREADAFEAEHGRRRRVFCASLADVFDNQVPREWRVDLWNLIRQCGRLDWLLLTKRPQNIRKMLPPDWGDGWPHVWLGTTIENRQAGERGTWHLASVPAAVRFWSCEPLLEDLGDLVRLCLFDTAADGRPAVHWVIVGGESGPKARPMHPDWPRAIRDQCEAAGVPFLFKQWGGRTPKAGGNTLDGSQHHQWPRSQYEETQ